MVFTTNMSGHLTKHQLMIKNTARPFFKESVTRANVISLSYKLETGLISEGQTLRAATMSGLSSDPIANV